MTDAVRIALLRVGACTFTLLCCSVPAAPRPAPALGSAGPSPSHIDRINGVPTMIVGGKPFIIVGAQCDIWRSTRQDAKTVAFFEGFERMNATTVSVGIPWSKLEPAKDRYEFAFLDWFIHQAESHRLKLVINLFDTNVCGKVEEVSGEGVYPQYTPTYILSAPGQYQRMVLPERWKYAAGGPPMCPNDPHTLERERKLVMMVARHLRSTDLRRTVIMIQIDNEFYYQQWEGPRPGDEPAIRCQCAYCNARYASGRYKSGEDFMFRSFADYVKSLTDGIKQMYDIPLYVNSPWWNPADIPLFLDRCPNLSLVGIDGVFDPTEPNMLSMSQVSRNIPFAAENPTEQPKTRFNLDVLPYYTLVGEQGIGNLLWECSAPHTVVDDASARQRYADALYPIKNAQVPIARARGTANFLGWYALRDVADSAPTDTAGNFLVPSDGKLIRRERTVVREGTHKRTTEGSSFDASFDKIAIRVEGSPAGIILCTGPHELVLAIPRGRVTITGVGLIHAEAGRYDGSSWHSTSHVAIRQDSGAATLDITRAEVVRLRF